MTWGVIPQTARLTLMAVIFLVLCIQLFQLLRMYPRRKSPLWRVSAVWLVLLLALLCVLYDFPWLNGVPVWVLWGVAAVSSLFTLYGLCRGGRRYGGSVTRTSIKEAMDDLPMAGCYFTRRDTVKLCNRQMYRLYHAITGRDLQTLSELHEAMARCTDRGIGRTHDGGFVFPDGSVWYYTQRQTAAPDGQTYTEAIFTDGTEQYAANDELAHDNRELRRVNEKLQKMYARAEDRIREREYLTFKMKIHDDIGRSLAVIRRILQNETTEDDVARQLKRLSIAAGTLVYSKSADSDDPYDRLLAQAAELGVEIRLDGMLPIEPAIYDLVVQAIRECVTNCVRHAHGTAVTVRIAGITGGYTVTITNDGSAPHGPVREGGGLSNLRRSIENAGGEMTVSHYPEFALRFTLMREEMEL